MEYLRKRLTEGSTWGGLGLIALGVGEVFQIREAPQIAEVIGQAGEQVVAGDWIAGAIVLVTGVVAAFIRDKD